MPPESTKILTIEDEPGLRATIVAYLEDSGFQMIEAENGRVGLERCRAEEPDLILCDLRMPEMDGLELLDLVSTERPETPIIVVSGMGALGDAVQALKRGAWDYITKPIEDLAVLEHAIAQALERARLLRENREYREHLEEVVEQLQQSLARLEEDEAAGRRIQFQLLPAQEAAYGPYRFSHRLVTSLYLSGDFVDHFRIDAQRVGFYVADVSGHGVSSAFVTVLLTSYMNHYLEAFLQGQDDGILDPAEVLTRLNHDILRGSLGKYLTIFYAVIDIEAHRMRYASGGHFPLPILFDGDGARFVGAKSLPVGLFDFATYRADTLDLPPRFAMAILSDGILEILQRSNLQEKQALLLSALDDTDLAIETLTRRLGVAEAASLPDDVTVLVVKRDD